VYNYNKNEWKLISLIIKESGIINLFQNQTVVGLMRRKENED